MRCHFIPGYLLDRLVEHDDEHVSGCARHTCAVDEQIRTRRTGLAAGAQQAAAMPATAAGAAWEVHDAHHGSTLPGDLVRTAGQGESGDVAVDEAAVGMTESLALFADLGRSSYDDRGATVVATVHYEQDYDNAFWDGTQLVFGDGDGTVFGRFTRPIDVLGHELSHAVTQFTADLTYEGQSGALNESVSDVFGACTKQRHLGQDAASADWLVGEGIFLPGVQGRALRSMSDPGTAYDDPRLGKDPQVGHMDDYVETTDDNGGVHLNSGIPNRAFVLAARAVGGESWSGAGRIWYAALTSGLAADTDFAGFAAATVAAAGEHADAVRDAWSQVGVTASAAQGTPAPGGTGDQPAPATAVRVARSGGFAGQVRRGEVDLDSDDPRAGEARQLISHIDLRAVGGGRPQPDRFVYHVHYLGTETQVHEQDLTPELRRLVQLVLDEG